MKDFRKTILVVLGVALGLLLIGLLNPTELSWFPRCPFRTLTGWNCPGCGTARALHSWANGRWETGFRCNPYLPFLLAALLVGLFRPKWFDGVTVKIVIIVSAVVWCVVRNMVSVFAIPV